MPAVRPFTRFLRTTFVLVALSVCVQAELWIKNHEPTRHNRFRDDAARFVAGDHDLSGVGSATGWWVTMISPQYFLTADHAPASGQVKFNVGNRLGSEVVYIDVDWTQQVADADLRLGRLVSPVPDDIPYYPLLELGWEGDYKGLNVLMYGHRTWEGRVGRNTINGFAWDQFGYGSRLMDMPYNRTTGLGDDECWIQNGDSGAPSFAAVGDTLALVGIHVQVLGFFDGAEPQEGALSRDVFLFEYIDELRAMMASYGQTLTTYKPTAVNNFFGGTINPVSSFTLLSGWPGLGRTMTLGVDNPLGTQSPGSLAFVLVSTKPDANFPNGTLIPGMGMAGGGAAGELLIDVINPGPPIVYPGSVWTGPGVHAPVPIDIPDRPNLMGKRFFAQGFLIDPFASSGGVSVGLTRGLELVIGS